MKKMAAPSATSSPTPACSLAPGQFGQEPAHQCRTTIHHGQTCTTHGPRPCSGTTVSLGHRVDTKHEDIYLGGILIQFG
jgi:hypothetical protein